MDARDNTELKPFEKKPCKHCQEYKTFEGHDGCLGELPFLMNACCGHGGTHEGAYVQFKNGKCLRGTLAKIIQNILKLIRDIGR
jgi:hypothetical protein